MGWKNEESNTEPSCGISMTSENQCGLFNTHPLHALTTHLQSLHVSTFCQPTYELDEDAAPVVRATPFAQTTGNNLQPRPRLLQNWDLNFLTLEKVQKGIRQLSRAPRSWKTTIPTLRFRVSGPGSESHTKKLKTKACATAMRDSKRHAKQRNKPHPSNFCTQNPKLSDSKP